MHEALLSAVIHLAAAESPELISDMHPCAAVIAGGWQIKDLVTLCRHHHQSGTKKTTQQKAHFLLLEGVHQNFLFAQVYNKGVPCGALLSKHASDC